MSQEKAQCRRAMQLGASAAYPVTTFQTLKSQSDQDGQ